METPKDEALHPGSWELGVELGLELWAPKPRLCKGVWESPGFLSHA